VLEDLNSANGTYINARRIKKRAIRAGDLITIGKTRFRYGKRPAERAAGETNNVESHLYSELT
jgi:pSer/pThr/pTyr-binding forkhead associated (FHA) protein